ncbi:antA/AntB antirepressor family protein [Bacillus sp. XF8]|uniref:antA/AntB antirepressor family protein n=1 Tax=Bacillus sp. XF8 TaxID=2819289 RepID=UPI001AA08E76|nr:antA/AntB antirepressor family protein [Bacillus sp. XF8]MBO1583007.1 antA/AntB antirepressor family protein [Bacillus sp. XF8]
MNKLKVVANEMLPIYQNENGEKFVNARELHENLMSKQKFADWIKKRIDNYGFVENEDFFITLGKSSGGRPTTDYILTLDTAKEVSMVENNEMGRAIRKYFIKVEKRHRQEQPTSPLQALQMAVNRMVLQEQKMIQLEQQVTTVQHRINSLDTIDTEGDLQQRLNKMIQRLAWNEGVNFQEAWKMFRNAYNTAYKTNLRAKLNNYKEKHGLKQLTVPQYLSLTNQLSDAVRVADKLLNKGSATA